MFNLITQTSREYATSASSSSYLSTQAQLLIYTVDNDGCINFPILGRLKVEGMTKFELEDFIANQIYPKYTKEKPLVIVNYTNFKISVLGEVSAPGQYSTTTGKVNIFEALALARDLTIWGRRDCVKLIRESAKGEKQIVELNLNDANIINSPYYQLQQNDIIYVTPNKTKAKNSGVGSETSLWFTSTSILVSLASLLYNILK
jgi:polysaccharide export outer membrane protein